MPFRTESAQMRFEQEEIGRWIDQARCDPAPVVAAIRHRTECVVQAFLKRRFKSNLSDADYEILLDRVYERLKRALPSFHKELHDRFVPWVLAIALHAAIDFWRSLKPTVSIESIPEMSDDKRPTPPEHLTRLKREAAQHEAFSDLELVLKQLSLRQRHVVWQHVANNVSYGRIAEELHISVEAVRQHKYNAIKKLRDTLSSMGYSSSRIGDLFS